jgi:hypothetical protein
MNQSFTEEFVTEQIQKRYVLFHILKMNELCYGSIVRNNEKINESHIPQFIECINKLNGAVGFVQSVSDELTAG